MKSSQLAFRNLTEWTEFQLLGPRVYSSSLRFQTHIIIHLIKSSEYENAVLKNCVYDYRTVQVDLTLFGFILRKLLLFILNFNDTTGELEINSSIHETDIIISISGFRKETFKKLIRNCIKGKMYEKSYSQSDTDDTLKLCYDILSFYSGNLWSESFGSKDAKLCFSIPGNKNL